MTKVFGATSTTDEVLEGINLQGKRILVTGVSAGLGVETARAVAAHGGQVTGAARDLGKAEAATAEVRRAAAANGGSFTLVALDLANLKSVRACADGLLARGEPFDVVIANAGVMATPFGHTADGFETQFGTNHLGHFVLVNRIAPLIRAGGRLINLASSGHRFSNVDLGDPNFKGTTYDPWLAYGQSKTAIVLFAVEATRRWAADGITANAVMPGGLRTNLQQYQSGPEWDAIDAAYDWKTVEEGAATSVFVATSPLLDGIGGRYFENCHEAPVVDPDIGHERQLGVAAYALDPQTAQKLWDASMLMLNQ